MSRAAISVATLAAVLALSACGRSVEVNQPPTADAGGASAGTQAAGFTAFPDLPIPAKAKIDLEKTVVFGGGESWIGRLVLNAGHGSDAMFGFYRDSLPGFGWEEITSVRAAVSVLTYARDNRVATIQIEDKTLPGSEVRITVSPRGTPAVAAPATAPGANPPPVQSTP